LKVKLVSLPSTGRLHMGVVKLNTDRLAASPENAYPICEQFQFPSSGTTLLPFRWAGSEQTEKVAGGTVVALGGDGMAASW